MGGTNYSDDEYKARQARNQASGTDPFAFTQAVNSGASARQCHDKLNPLGVKLRESRDSDAHPESLAIGVIFDETGSMGEVPRRLQKKLSPLMALLISKGYVAHPQILFGAIGDANPDGHEVAPLQVGQFESGNEMEEDLSNIFLEGNGGGQQKETYELAHYFFLHHTAMDCFEKRGVKGYLFTIGDEGFYPVIRAAQVKRIVGDTLEADVDTKDVVAALQERFHVFHIIAEQGGYSHNATIEAQWRDLLGAEHVLKLEDTDNVVEMIASTIGICEGTDLQTAAANMKDAGASDAAVDSVTKSLVPLSKAGVMARAGTVTGDLPEPVGAGAPNVTRL